MITLDGLRVRKDSVKEVVNENGLFYVLTDDFIMINITKDECVLVYRECPKIKDNEEFYRRMFDPDNAVSLTQRVYDNNGQGENVKQ